jgi:hypothetical protein
MTDKVFSFVHCLRIFCELTLLGIALVTTDTGLFSRRLKLNTLALTQQFLEEGSSPTKACSRSSKDGFSCRLLQTEQMFNEEPI